jgi:hypothetical protein
MAGNSTHCRITLLAGLLALLPAAANAQAIAQNLEELRLKVKAGDIVYVRDQTGREQRGQIAELTSSVLGVTVGGERREFTDRSVLRIRQRKSDSLWTGGIIGAAVGGALGALAASVSEECSHNTGSAACAGPVLSLTAVGLGVGVGIDALIQGRKVIYDAPQKQARLVVMPSMARGGWSIRAAYRLP